MTRYAPIGVIADVTLGKMLQPVPKLTTDRSMPYLRAAHVQPGGRIDFDVVQKEMWFSKADAVALDLKQGDAVVVEGGAGFGRSAYLKRDLTDWGFQNSILRLRGESASDGRYLTYALSSALDSGAIDAACDAATFAHFTAEKVARFRVPFHSPDERKRIADCLDHETGEIDAMLAKMDELTQTLEERRISMVRRETQFEARGRRWETVPTAHLFGSIGSGTTPKDQRHYTESGDGVPWVTTSELREAVVTGTNKQVTQEAIAEVSSLRIHPAGAVIIAMYGATIGRLGVLGVDATMNQACCAFSEPRGIDMRFFYYTLWGQRDDIVRLAVGGGQPNISQTMLRRWRIPSPPPNEQVRIADHLDEITGKIDEMLAKTAELKNLLIERRAALITDVVTGKKQVP